MSEHVSKQTSKHTPAPTQLWPFLARADMHMAAYLGVGPRKIAAHWIENGTRLKSNIPQTCVQARVQACVQTCI